MSLVVVEAGETAGGRQEAPSSLRVGEGAGEENLEDLRRPEAGGGQRAERVEDGPVLEGQLFTY
jgi:hypothetical protein